MDNYDTFLDAKTHYNSEHGFSASFMPDCLFAFQADTVEWATRKGRSAIFADCGLGKTFMQLTWAENVARHTGGRVLVLTPLAVAFQTVQEGIKIDVDVTHRREGIQANDRIVVTNYERLHHFDPSDFVGVVCDESSILKNFDGATRQAVTDFMRKRPYRLLCTATASPNDYVELGTSSEALGNLGATDMVNQFFKKSEKTTSRKDEHRSGLYRFRGHAERDFWRWVVSWARAFRKPSDIGYDDNGFRLPELCVTSHTVKTNTPRPGFLFDMPAVGLQEQRADLRHTLNERCDMAAQLINAHNDAAIAWCNLNDEGDTLAQTIRDAEQISGNDTEERKEEIFNAFLRGDVRVLVTKPTIGGFGLNFQHCAHQTFFPSHSYEQYYQCVRRSWRFGQTRNVQIDMITTNGQDNVLANLQRKSEQADAMFGQLVTLMRDELNIQRVNDHTNTMEIPAWL